MKELLQRPEGNWFEEMTSAALREAALSRVLSLQFQSVYRIPNCVFSALKHLVMLDISHNPIEEVPDEIADLKSLHGLFMFQCSELQKIPAALGKCANLKILDARRTAISHLPTCLGESRLEEILLDGAEKLEHTQRKAFELFTDEQLAKGIKIKPGKEQIRVKTDNLKQFLRKAHEMKSLERKIRHEFEENLYRSEAETEAGQLRISSLISQVVQAFQDADDLRSVLRHCTRLFPTNLDAVDVGKIRERQEELKRDNERKKLAANLELKVRRIYFNVIEPNEATELCRKISQSITKLADMQFLIQHGSKIFPKDPKQVELEVLIANLHSLREAIAQEREQGILGLLKAAEVFYGHVDPAKLEPFVRKASSHFSKPNDLKLITADMALYFPSKYETLTLDTKCVKRAFAASKN